MRLPLSWLTSMVDVDLTLDDLVDRLSASGLEVEGVTTPGAGVHGVRMLSSTDGWSPSSPAGSSAAQERRVPSITAPPAPPVRGQGTTT